MPTITQLEYLVSVYNHGHFGRAARACHISQPTLSMQLKKMEEELGIVFFDRSHQPIVPTSEGEAFIAQAKTILHEVGKLAYMSKDCQEGMSGEVTLAVIPTLSPYLLPRLLPLFSAQYPRVALTIRELMTREAVRALEERHLDVALLANEVSLDGLVTKALYTERFMVVLHRESELAAQSSIAVDDLRHHPLWLLGEGHCFRDQAIELCGQPNERQVLSNVHFESGNLHTLVALVAMGEGATLIPEMAMDELMRPEIVIRPFRSPAPVRQVTMVSHRSTYKQDMLAALAGLVETCVADTWGRPSSRSVRVIGKHTKKSD